MSRSGSDRAAHRTGGAAPAQLLPGLWRAPSSCQASRRSAGIARRHRRRRIHRLVVSAFNGQLEDCRVGLPQPDPVGDEDDVVVLLELKGCVRVKRLLPQELETTAVRTPCLRSSATALTTTGSSNTAIASPCRPRQVRLPPWYAMILRSSKTPRPDHKSSLSAGVKARRAPSNRRCEA